MGDNTVRKVEKGAEKLKKKAKGKDLGLKLEELGSIDVLITYTHETLVVSLGGAQGLKVMDKKSSDPFAKVYLLQSNPAALFEKGHEKTKTHKKNLNPDFNEKFTFKGIDQQTLQNTKLVVSVWDDDLLSGDDFMGGIRVSLSKFNHDMKASMEVQFEAKLMPADVDGHPLEVNLERQKASPVQQHSSSVHSRNSSVHHQTPSPVKRETVSSSSSHSSPERKVVKIPGNMSVTFKVFFEPRGALTLVLVRAQGLPDKDMIGKSDPYGKIYLVDGHAQKHFDHKNKLKTKTVKNNQNPEFNEAFEFHVNLEQLRPMKAVIELWDDDFGKDQFLAGVMFRMAHFELVGEMEVTCTLNTVRKDGLPIEVYDVAKFGSTKSFSSRHTQKVSVTSRKSFVEPIPSRRTTLVKHRDVSPPYDGSRDTLMTSNDLLVNYIDKARVMANAKDIADSIPRTINVEEHITAQKSDNLDMNNYVGNHLLDMDIKNKLRLARENLEILRSKNRNLKNDCDNRESLLAEKNRRLMALESDLGRMHGMCTQIEYEMIRSRETLTALQLRRDHYIEHVTEIQHLTGGINTHDFHFDNEKHIQDINRDWGATNTEIEERIVELNLPILANSTFRERMMNELNAKRKTYLSSIKELRHESSKLMSLYEGISEAKEREILARLRNTSPKEMDNFFRDQEAEVGRELDRLRGDIGGLDLQHRQQIEHHERQLRALTEEFQLYRSGLEAELQASYNNYGAGYHSYVREQLELSIYAKLLEFEESRLSARRSGGHHRYRSSVTTHTIRETDGDLGAVFHSTNKNAFEQQQHPTTREKILDEVSYGVY